MTTKFESRVGRATVGNTGKTPPSAVSSKTSFKCSGWGAYRVYNSFSAQGKGKYKISFQTFHCSGKGVYGVLQNFSCSGKGVYRAANDTLARYELYKGVDEMPDFTAAPWETFQDGDLPYETAALDAGHTYQLVLRERNKYGVLSQSLEEWVLEVDGDGDQVAVRPSAPEDVAIEPAAGGEVNVTATYNFEEDGDNAAGQWLVYLTSDGSDPDPAVDEPVAVDMNKQEFIEFLDGTLSPPYMDDYSDDPFAGGSPRMTSIDYGGEGDGTIVHDAAGYLVPGVDSLGALAYYQDFDDREEIIVKARLKKGPNMTYRAGLVLRLHPGNKTFYTVYLCQSNIRLKRSDGDGNLTLLAYVNASIGTTWYNLKFSAKGTTLKCKVWPDDDPEPTTGGPDDDGYQIKETDATYSTGKFGFYARRSNLNLTHLDDFHLFDYSADGLTVKTLVRTRRVDAGPVNVDSDNVDIHTTTSDTDGPDAVTEAGIFFDDEYKQYPDDGG